MPFVYYNCATTQEIADFLNKHESNIDICKFVLSKKAHSFLVETQIPFKDFVLFLEENNLSDRQSNTLFFHEDILKLKIPGLDFATLKNWIIDDGIEVDYGSEISAKGNIFKLVSRNLLSLNDYEDYIKSLKNNTEFAMKVDDLSTDELTQIFLLMNITMDINFYSIALEPYMHNIKYVCKILLTTGKHNELIQKPKEFLKQVEELSQWLDKETNMPENEEHKEDFYREKFKNLNLFNDLTIKYFDEHPYIPTNPPEKDIEYDHPNVLIG